MLKYAVAVFACLLGIAESASSADSHEDALDQSRRLLLESREREAVAILQSRVGHGTAITRGFDHQRSPRFPRGRG